MLDVFLLQWNYCRQLQSWGLGFGAGWSILRGSRWLNPFCFSRDWRKKNEYSEWVEEGDDCWFSSSSSSSPGDGAYSWLMTRESFPSSCSSSQLLRFVNLRDGLGHVAERELHLIMRTQEVVTKLTQLLEEVVIDLCSPETEKTRSVASAPPPCCILHDMFSTWAQDVADNLQLAKHMLYVSPACCLAIVFQVSLPSFCCFFCVLEIHCRKSKKTDQRDTEKICCQL
jgi:hypothetical protein